MATDRSDPEQVERELQRLEKELSADRDHSDMRPLVAALRAALDAQKRTATLTDTLAEDIAALRGLLDRRDDARSTEPQPAAVPGLAQLLVEAEGRIAGHVDHLAESIRPVECMPEGLKDLKETVKTLAETVRAETLAAKSSTSAFDHLSVELKDMVRDAELRILHQSAEDAKGVREALRGTTAVVLQRRRSATWSRLRIAGGVMLGLLVCVGLGLWLQSEHGLLPPHDPTGGWRDYIWQEYGPAIVDCKREAQEAKREVDCPLSVPPPRR